jgi:signal transduction histidine kinase
MKKNYCILFLFCFLGGSHLPATAQTKITDSVRRLIATAVSDNEKVEYIYQLSNQSINPDSLLPYVLLGEQLIKTSQSKQNIDKIAAARAGYYVRKNYVDSALHIVEPLLAAYKKNKEHQDYYLSLLLFKAKILDRGNRYTLALKDLYEVLEKAAELKDTFTLIQAKTGIGWVQMEMEQYNEALQWLYKAMYTSANKKYYKNYGALFSNLASTYNALGKPDSAKLYIDIAIKDARENNNLVFLATALNINAKILIDSKQPQLAEMPLHEAVEIRKKLNDPFYTVYDMSSLASYYASNRQTAKGIALCKEGIALAKQSNLSSQLLMIYRSLAENYKAAGKIPEYTTTLESVIALKDSFNNINSSRLLANMQAASETQKNEKTILQQKLNLTIKNYWLFGSAVFGLLLAAIIWLAFKNYNRRQNIKMQLALDEEKRNAAQSVKEAEEQERRRIAADLHDNIGAYASAIRADVEKIMQTNHSKNDTALQNLQQHSQEIIGSLRDTIWVLNKEHITITGISDRIKSYCNKLQPSYAAVTINLHETIEQDIRISSRQALNIFRIVQEAVHNALKHSNAGVITIRIESSGLLRVTIADNGTGISIHSNAGNGLANMHARAAESGLQLKIDTAEGAGTTVLLTLATTN